jgi:phage terminase small subunit
MVFSRDNFSLRSRARISAWLGARWPQGRYMSDRSNLTVLKPTPLNARQEAFARNIAEGRRQREAYRSAGYAPTSDNATDANASRLLRHDKLQSRVRELQAAQAETSKITAEKLLAELEEARNLALGLGQAGAAVAASMGRAKLCGLLVDRREDVTRRPTREPDAPAEVAVEVWLREIAPSTSG